LKHNFIAQFSKPVGYKPAGLFLSALAQINYRFTGDVCNTAKYCFFEQRFIKGATGTGNLYSVLFI
jgi:hypothetical protein